MSFTDRFLKLPVLFVNKSQQEIGIENPDLIKGFIKILPLQIESYQESIMNAPISSENKNATIIRMKSGDSVCTPMQVSVFEDLLNRFDESDK